MINKFERCVLKVKSNQQNSCKSKNWKGKDCLNPWVVCHSSIDGGSSETTCPICLEEFTDTDDNIVIVCSNEHRFHSECIEDWMSGDNYECPLCKELITINMIKGTFYQKYISEDEGVIKSKFISDSSDVKERDIQNGDIRISQEYCTIYHINFYEDWNKDLNADTFTGLDWDDDFPKGLNFNEKCRTLVRDDIFASFYRPERYRLPKNIYVDSYVWNSKMNKETKKMFLQKFIYVYIITEFIEFNVDEGFEHFPESEEENSDSEEENSDSEDDGIGINLQQKSVKKSKSKRKSVKKSKSKSKRKSVKKSKSKRKSVMKSKSKRKSVKKSKRKSAKKSKRKSNKKSSGR